MHKLIIILLTVVLSTTKLLHAYVIQLWYSIIILLYNIIHIILLYVVLMIDGHNPTVMNIRRIRIMWGRHKTQHPTREPTHNPKSKPSNSASRTTPALAPQTVRNINQFTHTITMTPHNHCGGNLTRTSYYQQQEQTKHNSDIDTHIANTLPCRPIIAGRNQQNTTIHWHHKIQFLKTSANWSCIHITDCITWLYYVLTMLCLQ